ncbi:MAG: GAF domain-containing sensor histidine kinase [Anaerolineae bacterium]|nr:GAF domain-containing sensor histidine kinase [Anaerolineae bacterium]
MAPSSASRRRQWIKVVTRIPFWAVVVTLAAIILLHYATAQTRPLPASVRAFVTRHSVERILFLLPVALATSAFRWRGGAAALTVAILSMLPRALWISPTPVDALVETAATAVVASSVIYLIEGQIRERVRRQQMVDQLGALNAIAGILAESLELEQILDRAIDKVLQVTSYEVGLVFLVDRHTQELALAAYRGVSKGAAADLARPEVSERAYGQVARSGDLTVLLHTHPVSSRLRGERLQTQIAVPLRSKRAIQGILVVACRDGRQPRSEELDLLTAVGNQMGIAIENAQLYRSMRFYAREVTQAQEDERRRIARELHDETIQTLIVILRRLEALPGRREPLPEATAAYVEGLQDLLRDAVRGIRRFIQDLRPAALDHLGFVPAVEGLAADLTERESVQVDVRVEGEARRLAPEEELILFRIAQEALNNVRRHSGASKAAVQVTFHSDSVQMVIEDNGGGFDVPERVDDLVPTRKLGLVGMYERARTLGGSLDIRSSPGQGTAITVFVPVQPQGQR